MSEIVYKRGPFYLYELVLNQAYLADMSRAGLHVQAYNWGNFEFMKGEPKDIIYKIKIWTEEPTEEQISDYKNMGWQYLFHYYSYYFFCRFNKKQVIQENMSTSETKWIYKKIKQSYVLVIACILLLAVSIGICITTHRIPAGYIQHINILGGGILIFSLLFFLRNRFGYYVVNRNLIKNNCKLPFVDWKKYRRRNAIINISTITILILIAGTDIIMSIF